MIMQSNDSTRIKSLILDMDGVLWRDTDQIGNLKTIFTKINQLGLSVAFATNNSTKTPDQYLSKFNGFGVDLSKAQIFTSSLVTADYLASIFPEGGSIYCIGESGLFSALSEKGFYHGSDSALAVIVGLDRAIDYRKINEASNIIRNGALFIGTNPDTTYPIPGGFSPGTGTIVAAVAASAGKDPLFIGKPEIEIYNSAINYLETPIKNCLIVGDRLETDIAGAHKIGAQSAVVLSGVASQSQIDNWLPSPDFIARDLTNLLEILEEKELT